MTNDDIADEIEMDVSDDSGPSFRYLIAVWGASVVLIVLYIPLGIFPQQIIDTILDLIPNITAFRMVAAAVAYLMGKEIYESFQARNIGQRAAEAAGGLTNIGGGAGTELEGLFEDEKDEKERLKEIKKEIKELKRKGGLDDEHFRQFEDLIGHIAGDIENIERDLDDITRETGDGLTDHIVNVALSHASEGHSQGDIVAELENEEEKLSEKDVVTETEFLDATKKAKSRLRQMNGDIRDAEESSQDSGQKAEEMVQMIKQVDQVQPSRPKLNKALEQNFLEIVSEDKEMLEYEEDLNKIVTTATKAIDALERHERSQ